MDKARMAVDKSSIKCKCNLPDKIKWYFYNL